MSVPRNTRYDAVVIGAGLIGLACAWRRGARRSVGARGRPGGRAGGGASRVAAGMLAPVTEADFGDEDKLAVNLVARERWPAFAAELEEVTGLPTGYRDSGALVVAADRDDAEELRRLHEFQRSLGLEAEWLTPARCRALEPGLSPRIGGGILAHGDGTADPRAPPCARSPPPWTSSSSASRSRAIEHEGGRVTGCAARRARSRAATWSWPPARGARLSPRRRGPARAPGQGPDPRAARPRRRCARSRRSCALRAATSSRGDGRVVVGATVEEQGFDTTVTADGVFRLLEAAWEVLPEVGELELVEARTPVCARHARQHGRRRPGRAGGARVGHRALAQRGAARAAHRRGGGRDPDGRGAPAELRPRRPARFERAVAA